MVLVSGPQGYGLLQHVLTYLVIPDLLKWEAPSWASLVRNMVIAMTEPVVGAETVSHVSPRHCFPVLF